MVHVTKGGDGPGSSVPNDASVFMLRAMWVKVSEWARSDVFLFINNVEAEGRLAE